MYTKRLLELESSLLVAEDRRDRDFLDVILAVDFVEFGSIGFVYDKAAILERLPNDASDDLVRWEIEDFKCVVLAENIVQTRFQTRREFLNETISS